ASSLYDLTKTAYYDQSRSPFVAPFADFSSNYTLSVAKQDGKVATWELPGDKTGDSKIVETWKADPAGSTTKTYSVTLDQLTKNFAPALSYQDTGVYDVALEAQDPGTNATTVKYLDAKGNSYNQDVDVKYGEVVPTDNLVTSVTTAAGYISQWYWNSDVSGARIAWTKGDTAKKTADGVLKLYAGTSSAAYKVTYKTQVGTTAIGALDWDTIVGSEYVTAGQSPKGVTPSRNADWTFLGWSKTPEIGASTVSLSSLKINADTTLYAQWTTDKATVTYDYQYAGKQTTKEYASGETFTLPTDVTRDGWKLIGWYKDGSNVKAEYEWLKVKKTVDGKTENVWAKVD
ncbi:InlB B-repeat-containing protein, partial [Bifidobacterium amazonense]